MTCASGKQVDCRESRYRRSKKVVRRQVAGEVLLIPIGSQSEVETLFTLNEVADQVWAMLDSPLTVEEISLQLVEQYDVSMDVARKDVEELVSHLSAAGVVEECP